MNAAPVVVGFLALLALAATLVVRAPSPGALARPHESIGSTLATCSTCHTEQGLDAGCLACHDAIAEQIENGRGFHAERRSDCAQCHPDHHGQRFDVMEAIAWGDEERASFRHDHVEFKLAASHDDLACDRISVRAASGHFGKCRLEFRSRLRGFVEQQFDVGECLLMHVLWQLFDVESLRHS